MAGAQLSEEIPMNAPHSGLSVPLARPIGLGAPGVHARAVQGRRHMIAAGHHAATQAGHAILEAGGNAVDAGVAEGLALGVVIPDVVNIAGVAPIMLRMAESGETVTQIGRATDREEEGQYV